ncbi:MAG: DUF935 family protein [Bacteroidales bacterium]|nr:DUF935 family protein [Bacteroidales bacterium]
MTFKQHYNNIKRGIQLAYDARFSGRDIKLVNGMTRGQAKSIISRLDMSTKQLTQKEIAHWRQANQIAIDIENPQRYFLYSIYDDTMHDLHIKGAVRNRKLAVLGKPFKVTDTKGNINEELTQLLHTKWFRQFLRMAMDARFYGHSLIELTDIVRDGGLKFKNVNLVPRHHVCPEYATVLINPMDDPKQGIPYREGDLIKTCIEVGDSHDLGELNSVSKEAISKKFIMQFWDTFAEIFGMPIRTASTTSRDPKDHKKIEEMLEGMGAAAWGLFPEGTLFEVSGSQHHDSYKVYDQRILRVNSEISKALMGQTMTMDDGSSLSQAKVHEGVSEELADDDRVFIHDVVNGDLFPFLIMHGWPLKGYIFHWDNAYEYSPEEMKGIEEMLLTHYDIDQEYFIEKYGVKIIGKKQQQMLMDNEKNGEASKKKSLPTAKTTITHRPALPDCRTNKPALHRRLWGCGYPCQRHLHRGCL